VSEDALWRESVLTIGERKKVFVDGVPLFEDNLFCRSARLGCYQLLQIPNAIIWTNKRVNGRLPCDARNLLALYSNLLPHPVVCSDFNHSWKESNAVYRILSGKRPRDQELGG
jgi:hypothetical protein